MATIENSAGRRAITAVHSRAVFGRRVRVLASAIGDLLPERAKVLDVGCGSGDLASALLALKPGLDLEGVDVLVRPNTAIPVSEFDGQRLPFADRTFDFALLVDVLHHTDDPAALLREVGRVARHLIVKDHYRNGLFADARLRFMDWVGNAPHGVRLPYNYLSRGEWAAMWRDGGFTVERKSEDLRLYPAPADWIFGRGLHFVVKLSGR
jgi:SAM-dependent methyltransferase